MKALLEAVAEELGAFVEFLLCNHIKNGIARRNADRAASVSTAQSSGPWSVHDMCAARHSCDGKSSAEAFCHSRDVGDDTMMLHGEELSGTRETRLNLIGDEENTVSVGDIAKFDHEGLWNFVEATFSLDGLDNEGRHTARIDIRFEELVELTERILD